jgi:hypothetical protein
MNAQLDEQVAISLPKGTLLVLSDNLAHSYKLWRGTGDPPHMDTFVLQQRDAGERTALWHLDGAIERTLPEMFSADYVQLVAQWKQRLASS